MEKVLSARKNVKSNVPTGTPTDAPVAPFPTTSGSLQQMCPWKARRASSLHLAGALNGAKYDGIYSVRISATDDEMCVRVHFSVVEATKVSSQDAPCRTENVPRFALAYRPKQVNAADAHAVEIVEAVRAGCYTHADDLRPMHHFVADMGPRVRWAYVYSIHEVVAKSEAENQNLFDSASFTYVSPPLHPETGATHLRLGGARQRADSTTSS